MIPANRRVSRDDPGEAELECQIGDCVDVLVREVRRDLYQQRNVPTTCRIKGILHRSDQRTQFTNGLQIAQAWRVG